MDNRKAPMPRLITSSGCGIPQRRAARDTLLAGRKVGIQTEAALGAACEPVVNVGAARHGRAKCRPPADGQRQAGPGAPVHASIDGTVTAIDDGVVWIERK